jgi:4-hydroxy-3-methylbut-2-enyl diphosphate reductase
LAELAKRVGAKSYLIDGAADIDPAWLEGCKTIGLTAGASAPEVLVQEVVDCLKSHGVGVVENLEGREENITFSLPKELKVVELS